MWVDTHCHLYASASPAEELLERAAAAGVDWLVCPGVDAETSQESVDLAERYDGRVLASAGLHPHYADQWPEERSRITELANVASAVGECGLDFYRDLAPRSAQLVALRDQLELASGLEKPVIVHCRDAFAEIFDALESTGAGEWAILHCWTGGPRWTKRFADLGATFSFAGPITFDTGETVRHGAAAAPRSRTMIETDTPYLTPPPDRSSPNEPANVPLIGRALAGVWEVSEAEAAGLTSTAATRVFR